MCSKLIANFAHLCAFFCLIYNFANAAPQNVKYKTNLCARPFTAVGKNCYYLAVTDKLSCSDAAAECAKLDAELAKIENGQAMQAINDLLIAQHVSQSMAEQTFWIAGNDLHYRGYFFWQFPFARMNYANWAAGRPDRAHAMSASCVQLAYAGEAYYMIDTAAFAHSHFICEKSQPQVQLSSAEDTKTTSACPVAFTRIGAKCYLIEQHAELDLLDARIKCSESNAELADIQDMQEQAALSQYLTSLNERNEYRVLAQSFKDLHNEFYARGNATYDNCVQLFYMDGAYGLEKCACREKMRYICQSRTPTSSRHISGAACPGLFVALLSKCYFFEDYMSLNRNSAESYCQQIGAQLSHIESAQELAVLSEYLKETASIRKLWIAGTKQHNVTDFTWSAANAKVSYTKWAAGEPQRELGAEKCIKLLYDDGKDAYYMHSADCRDASFFICNTDAVQTAQETAPQTTAATAQKCALEFALVGQKCYYFEKTLKSNWRNARAACFYMGADLLKMQNKHEQIALSKYLQSMHIVQTFWIASAWHNAADVDDVDFDIQCSRLAPLNGAYQVYRNSCLYNDYFICESAPIGTEDAIIENTITHTQSSMRSLLFKKANLQQDLRISGSAAAATGIKWLCVFCFILNNI